ncbi:MAG: YraN family protein [Nocardioidaceae bacterium]|nr:YraN family protein [Nocardioidaceae bacterium]
MDTQIPGGRNQALGTYGERLAERYLCARGMTILDRNWRCPAGEIDLVLREGDVLVLCEVKTRRHVRRGHPFEAVTGVKLERLHRLAALWQEARQVRPADVRLDMVGVLVPRRGVPQVEHVRGVG